MRVASPGLNYWNRTYSASTYPYFLLSIRTTFGTGVWNGSVEIDDGTPDGPCHYGAERSDLGTDEIVLTDTVITIALIPFGLAWVAAIFDGLSAVMLSTADLCGSGPPEMPASVAYILQHPEAVLTGAPSFDDLLQAMKSLLWRNYCQCKAAPPGDPDPIPYPAPLVTPPAGGVPVIVEQLCDNQDLCSTLNAIMRQLQGLTFQVGLLRRDTTLIQRQAAPFGYVLGTVHSGLTGAGSFTVGDILGLSVNVTTVPARFIPRGADPQTYDRLGWVNTGTTDGWQRATEIRHNPELILPIDGAVTEVGYDLADDVVVTITELVREP